MDTEYIGDGVYVRDEHGILILSTERLSGTHWLGLGPSELASLVRVAMRNDAGFRAAIERAVKDSK